MVEHRNRNGTGAQTLLTASELDDPSAIAFARSTLGQRSELLHRLSFFGGLQAEFLAGVGLSIKLLRYGCGATYLAQFQNLDFEVAAFVLHMQHIANAHIARRLCFNPVGVYSAKIARL